MKKVLSVVLAVALVLAMGVMAFAANDGSITVENAYDGQEYTAYRVFDLASFDKTAGTYNYTVYADWEDFVLSDEIMDKYVSLDPATNYVTWIAGADVAEFAALAKEFIKDSGITGTKSAIAKNGTATMKLLPLGYYLVDSTVGSLVALDTTDKAVTVVDKNPTTELDKEVQENSTEEWGKENDANIGDTVNFHSTFVKRAGIVNYVVHDNMDAGLTFDPESVVVSVDGEELEAGVDYTVAVPGDVVTPKTGNPYYETFKVVMNNDSMAALEDEAEVLVEYAAVLNENAVIYPEANENEAHITFGENNNVSSEPSITETYTYSFDLVKTNASDVVLEGAEFKLWADDDKTEEIAVVKVEDGLYRVAVEGETGEAIVAGNVTIEGLDSGLYFLEETKAPEGFNKLNDLVEVEIEDANLEAAIDVVDDVEYYDEGGVQVVNESGAELPSTGGMGTTIFTVVGLILVAGAAVILFARKRMAIAA